MSSRKQIGAAALAAALAGAAAPAIAAQPAKAPPPATSIAEAVTAGKFQLSARYRLENVDDDAFAKQANASTVRLRITYETRPFHGLGVLLEGDRVQPLGGDAYNSTRNRRADRPQVADPEGTDLNQALLRWKGAQDELVLGRQRINLDNQRFVGGVGWRQNEQTMDAFTWRTTRVPSVTFTYSYVADVHRVFGPREGTPPAHLTSDSHLVNAAWDLKRAGKLTAFAYLLDFRRAATLSSATYGVLWTGTREIAGGWRVPWTASWASQHDYGANPVSVDARYWEAEAGVGHGPWTAKAGYEVLGGDRTRTGRAFQTPLATLHAFQGWADKFLTTPPQGVKDAYVSIESIVAGPATRVQLAWHDYRAEAASRHYGREWNASVSHRFGKRYELLLKGAAYDAATFGTDTTKWWAQFSATYP